MKIAVQKIHVGLAAVEALRIKERQGEIQEPSKLMVFQHPSPPRP